MLSKEDTDMANAKRQEDTQVTVENKPMSDLEKAKQELEYSYKRIEELEEQNKNLVSSAQKLYQENQTLKASLKAVASLL